MSKMGGSLENPTSSRVLFACATMRKIRELYLAGTKETEGGDLFEKNSSDRGIVSWSNRWAGKWFCLGTYPPQPSVGARWRLGKEKGVTDFSVTLGILLGGAGGNRTHDLLNAMPAIILKLLDFGCPSFIFQSIFLAPANGYLAFCGDPANVLSRSFVAQPKRLWRACQRCCSNFVKMRNILSNINSHACNII